MAETVMRVARSELILGGQKSGKSRRAESLAAAWLARSPAEGPDHRAVLIATASAHDDEMRERIARHQRERGQRVPGMMTVEAVHELPAAIAQAGGTEKPVLPGHGWRPLWGSGEATQAVSPLLPAPLLHGW